MKFNLHRTEYPFEQVPNVTIQADSEEEALVLAKTFHANKDNPHPVVSVQVENGHAPNH